MTLITMMRNNKKIVIGLLITTVILVIAILVLLVVTFVGAANVVARGAVVTNGRACARIGTDILEKGGTAADAAIAALFCEGVSMPQSMGLGGGFLLTLYRRSTGEAWYLNSRETAPAASTENMFQGNESLAQVGGLAIAVPGELRGYWTLYNRFGGGVPWKDLVQPTIDLCENGIYVSSYGEKVLKRGRDRIMARPLLRETFVDPKTNDTYKEGSYYKRLILAKTLRIIAEEGGDTLNNGSVTDALIKDIQEANGIITKDDLINYKPIWTEPHSVPLSNGQKVFTTPLPGSGSILTFILNILDGFLDPRQPKSITNYQRIIESFKFAYGSRTKLGDLLSSTSSVVGDENLINNLTSKEYAETIRRMIFDNRTFNDLSYYGAETLPVHDQGTANINVLAPNGDAIAVTSTINGLFGAYVMSPSTGILLNNQMDDFASPGVINLYGLPPSPANFIVPGRRPLSSMCPSIVLDENGNVVLVIGAAGGSKITSQVAQIIINHLWFGADLKTVLAEPRVHHQLVPNSVEIEREFMIKYPHIVEGLQTIGHNVRVASPDDGFAAATAISTATGLLSAEYDTRRLGSSSFIF